jgi:nitrogenase molybdenum-iron protein alpha/beta subunit
MNARRNRRAPARTATVFPTYETGVFLGINALENSVLVMNSPRCSFVRGMKVFLHNDLFSTVYRATGRHRVITTEWMSYEDVGGNEEAFARLLRDLGGPADGQWVFAFQNISSLVSGFDLAGVSKSAGGKGKRVLVPLEGPRLDEDWLSGYDAVLAGVLGRILDGKGRRTEVVLAGNLFCRNEADETANVDELRSLLRALGVERPAILLAGGELRPSALRPRVALAMPYAGRRSEEALAAASIAVERVGLPVGIGGTVDWLRAAGRALGRGKAAEACIDRELSVLIPQVQWIVAEHLLGRKAAVVADAHLGAGLVRFLRELGLAVQGWFRTSQKPVDGTGRPDPSCPAAECPVFDHPSAELFASFLSEREPDLVIGSSLFKYLAADHGIPSIELGFPSYLTHVLHPRPYFGFAGARCIIESLFDALLNADQQRSVPPG